MPTTGVPFRVYFFWFGSVAWFDQDVDGSRVWGSGGLEQVWPDVTSMMVADHAEQAPIERAYPVSVAIDVSDPETVDGLAPVLTNDIHALFQEAACNAADERAEHEGDRAVRHHLDAEGAGRRLVLP